MTAPRFLMSASVGSDCPSGKRQWASKAVAIANASSQRDGDRGRNLNAYRCVFCGCWHVGNQRGATNSKGRTRR